MRPLWLAAGVFVIATLPAQASETIGYSYDALGRLTGVSHAGSANNGLSSTIAYDPADNRTSYVTTGAASAPTLSVDDVSVPRGAALQFTVSRSGPAGGAISVAYATADGTARAGTDYTAASGTLGFAAGEMSKTVSVATSSNVVADDRTLTLVLSSPSAGVTLGRGTATGTIKGNPPPPVSFAIGNAAPVTEGGTLRLLRREKPEILSVISYADPVRRTDGQDRVFMSGHVGGLYAVMSARYIGRSNPRTDLLLPGGRPISSRALSKIRNAECGQRYAMDELLRAGARPPRSSEDRSLWLADLERSGFLRRRRHFGCHRYVFPLTRAARHAASVVPGLPYPVLDRAAMEGDVTALPLLARAA